MVEDSEEWVRIADLLLGQRGEPRVLLVEIFGHLDLSRRHLGPEVVPAQARAIAGSFPSLSRRRAPSPIRLLSFSFS